jgi:hypothetical protein
MMSDMGQHEETRPMNAFLQQMGLAIATSGDPLQARRWIQGFH